MGKVLCAGLAACLAASTWTAYRHVSPAHAQTLQAQSCDSEPAPMPMQGHYTGAWRSNAYYTFSVFGTTLDLQINIDGTLDLTISADGHVSGTASGNVDAPITDYGRHDISSGVGTIGGPISGVVSSSGSLLVLSGSTIDMHWGTFGGGHAVERTIAMPDYTLSTSSTDCVSAGGSITENGFPEQNVVDDSGGRVAQAPGVGTAGGTWSIQSDKAPEFADLSQRLSSFITSANTTLAAATPSWHDLATVLSALQQLRSAIQQDPDVSRCLMARLAAWEGSAVPQLMSRVPDLVGRADPVSLRQAGDLLRFADALGVDCDVPDSSTPGLQSALAAWLDRSISHRRWSETALALREILLSGVAPAEVHEEVSADVHDLTAGAAVRAPLLEAARVAAVVGDTTDSRAAYLRLLTAHSSGLALDSGRKSKKRPPSHKKKAKKTTARPTATPTPTPSPPSLAAVLLQGVTAMTGSDTSNGTLIWSQVQGAARYVVFVTGSDGAPLWAWSGTGASVTYGDTQIDGLDGSTGEPWPVPLPAGSDRWGVLALDGSGAIVGLKLPDGT